jgi:hypothetical protein
MEKWRKNAALRSAIVAMEHLTTMPMTTLTERQHVAAAAKEFRYALSYCEAELKDIDAKAETAKAKATVAAAARIASDRAAAFIAAHAS